MTESLPYSEIDVANLQFASDDGDAIVVAKLGGRAELHRRDSGTGAWTELDSAVVPGDYVPAARELEPGQFVYAQHGGPLPGQDQEALFTFEHDDDELSELADMPFPDDYVAGTLVAVRLVQDDGVKLTHRSYDLDELPADADELSLDALPLGPQLLAKDGHVYVMWRDDEAAHVAMHDADGWAGPMVLPTPEDLPAGSSMMARNAAGDVAFTTEAYIDGTFAAMATVYSEEARCWQPSVQLDQTLLMRPFSLTSSRDFLLVGQAKDRQATLLSCSQ